jgi:hypothetical protein
MTTTTTMTTVLAADDRTVRGLAEWHPHVEDDSLEADLSRAARVAIARGERPAISRAWGFEAGRLDAGYVDPRDAVQVAKWVAAARAYHGSAYAEGYQQGILSGRGK